MGKTSLIGVVRGYGRTLRNYRTGRLSLLDLSIQILIPIALGISTLFINDGIKLNNAGDSFVTGVSIVSALLCGVAIMAFQLRLQIASDGKVELTRRERELLDGLFYDVTWAVVAGFSATFAIIISKIATSVAVIAGTSTAVAICLLANFILVTCMSIKRLCAVYDIISRQWS